MENIKDIELQLINIEEQKKELLLKDLFLKSKLILDFLKIDEFIIEKRDDVVSGNIFENFPMSSIVINENENYHEFDEVLTKLNLSISDLELGSILKKNVKITTDMSFDTFKSNAFSIKKKI